ncbi:MAG: hypothetical protein ACK48A_04500, partial [Pseudanabaena sp.]
MTISPPAPTTVNTRSLSQNVLFSEIAKMRQTLEQKVAERLGETLDKQAALHSPVQDSGSHLQQLWASCNLSQLEKEGFSLCLGMELAAGGANLWAAITTD